MRTDVGIAFAGGGIKTLCQPAFIEWMEVNNIHPQCVSGTSAGAMIASLVAMGLPADEIFDEIKEAILELEKRKVLRVSGIELLFQKNVKHGLIDGHRMLEIIEAICIKHRFEHISDVKIPLALTAVDLYTGTLVVFVSHPHLYKSTHPRTEVISDIKLSTAITSSMSFPMVFGSVEYEDYALIDGGVRMNAPIPMLRDYGAKKTLALTMRSTIDREASLDKALEVASRVYDVLSREAEARHVSRADYLLNFPVKPKNIFDLNAAHDIYNHGKEVVVAHDESLKAFFKKDIWAHIKELF